MLFNVALEKNESVLFIEVCMYCIPLFIEVSLLMGVHCRRSDCNNNNTQSTDVHLYM